LRALELRGYTIWKPFAVAERRKGQRTIGKVEKMF